MGCGNVGVVSNGLSLPQAASYCESFDLNVTGSNVYFDRLKTDSINLEGKSVVLEKSHHLVLNKNRLSLGEVQRSSINSRG